MSLGYIFISGVVIKKHIFSNEKTNIQKPVLEGLDTKALRLCVWIPHSKFLVLRRRLVYSGLCIMSHLK